MLRVDISGQCKVFRNDYTTSSGGTFAKYTTSIGKKLQDGSGWENGYINLQFRKGVELANKTDIEIVDGWLTFDKQQRGEKSVTFWKIFVNEFETIEEQSDRVRRMAEPAPSTAAFASADDEDIPW